MDLIMNKDTNETPSDPQDNNLYQQAIEKIAQQISGHTLMDHIEEETAKLTDSKREIVIQVIAKTYSIQELENTVALEEIAKKNYHIPVPETNDHNLYLKSFFDLLENCMSHSATNAEANNE